MLRINRIGGAIITYLPLLVNLTNKSIVIIGGGKVAERRLSQLLDFKQSITVVSPTLTDTMKEIITINNIKWSNAPFRKEDIENADLIIVATNDETINDNIIKHAPKTAWINAAHHAEKGTIHFPITLKRGRLQIAISTGGASPLLAKRIKKEIDSQFPEDYEGYIDFLFEARAIIKKLDINKTEKHQLLKDIVHNPIYETEKQQTIITTLKKQM
ncbi:NAD(P)-binding protein [Gracilibacillus massiliensis]|uniref:NAD(P)-binding protein n=1 Tax=Gracilibacillus massiliensis TaxID=1564956 RepID=UPI00097CA302|nr:NAD(P)-binding protein [Gracilibacillus massiliensis]